MTDRLIKIINANNSTLDDVKDDYRLLAARLAIDITYHYSPRLIQDEIIKRFKADFDKNGATENDSISVNKLGEIAENLIYKFLLFEEPVLEYLNILQTLFTIKDARIKRIPPLEDTESWGRIISNLKDYKLVSKNTYDLSPDTLREHYPQEYDRVTQLKKLISVGCKVSIINDDIEIKDTELAINRLDDLIKEIGGITLANGIFNLLKKSNYSSYFERYHLIRQGNGLSMHQKPQIPFGYLLNLCVKYPYENRSPKNINHQLIEIQNLSIAIVTGCYNVQHYNQWTNFFQTGETIIKFCTEIALWDSIYSLIQIRPQLSLEILQELFNEIDDEIFVQIIGVYKEDCFSVIRELFNSVKSINGIKIIYLSAVSKAHKNIDKQEIKKILDLISHSSIPNSKYLLPSDITEVDFQFNPLVKLGETKYILMDKSWCSPSLFESFATEFRLAKVKNFDSNIGYALEKLIYNWLLSHNITYWHGNYTIDSINGECDLLIETNEAIILIEFKKKVLTRKAKSGIDINILIDLSDSILSSQLQAGRTELALREKGEITLTDIKTNSSNTVYWKKRTIERISLTQLDFGGFHDKTIINQFFNALLTNSYGTHSEEKRIIKKFESLKEKQQVWGDQYTKLKTLDKGFDHFPFFNCSFLNLGQLLEIINLSSDNDSFYDRLKSNKFVTFGTLDFYREFELKNNLDKNATR
jgi:hypothetical protein